MADLINVLTINTDSNIPKYKQIVNAICEALGNGELKVGDQLPSVQGMCEAFGLSRDTVFSAYRELKNKGLLSVSSGKGHYIAGTHVEHEQKVLLILAELYSFQENLYESFVKTLAGKASVDVLVHHFNPVLFEKMIRDSMGKYTAYVITPFNHSTVVKAIDLLPVKKVYILDRGKTLFEKKFPAVYQDFYKDVQRGLKSAINKLKKYKKLILVFPHLTGQSKSYLPMSLKKGFITFCEENDFKYQIIPNLNKKNITAGELYLLIRDNDLVYVIEEARKAKLDIGKQVGVISYNEMPLKSVIANHGVAVISSDFGEMGIKMANMILQKRRDRIVVAGRLIFRKSL